MDKSLNDSVSSAEALATRIRQLENELALLKAQASPSPQLITPAQESSSLPHESPANSRLNEQWLVESIKSLSLQLGPKGIAEFMASLGAALELFEASLWLWNSNNEGASLVQQWARTDVPSDVRTALAHGRWLAPLQSAASNLQDVNNHSCCELLAQLARGEPAVLDGGNSDALAIVLGLHHLAIESSLVLPVARHNQLLGFMVLHSDKPCHWSAQNIQILLGLVAWLFKFMSQHDQLQQLLEKDKRYQYAMEATTDGLWDWNLTTGKIYFSRSYLRMLGYDYDDLPGNLQTLKDYFVHPDDIDNILLEIESAVLNHRAALCLRYRMLHRDGHIVWVDSKAKLYEPQLDGRATRLVGINIDVSHFIAAQNDLLAAKAQADMASKTKSEFLARISHEIRTPMNAIIGVGYLMQDTSLDEQQQSYLTSINSAADSLLQIINQLLDFSKIETGRVILEHAHFDIEQVFEKTSRLFEISALHRNVTITYDIGEDVPRFLRGDASRLGQILNHLISNAFQYSGTDHVLVRVSRSRRKNTRSSASGLNIVFSVEDNGLGMSSEKLAYVNECLQHYHYGQDAQGNTCGMGICSHLVHLMNGDIKVASAPNEGCKVSFSVYFEPSHLGDNLLVNQSRDLSNIRVLIVDDNNIARTIIASTARSIHLQVDEIDQSLSAMDKIRQADNQGKPYHIVLLDYRMPGVNGLQLTGMIKKDRSLSSKPLVFLISAYHRDEISSTDPNAILVDEFLSKPVSESRLYDAISEVVNREQILQSISPVKSSSAIDFDILKNARVLVAEDNIVNQQVICGILRKKQVVCEVAGNGQLALDAIQQAPRAFDLVLMDLEMPVMDGLEATAKILAQWPDMPIIAVTAQAMRGDRERCLAAGMLSYISKPVNPELLYTTLAETLRQRKALQQEPR